MDKKVAELKADIGDAELKAQISTGDFKTLREWLRAKIHAVGSVHASPDELLMSITGEPNAAPVKVGVAWIDVITGLNAANAILAALFKKERTGEATHIDISLWDCAIAALVNQAHNAMASGENPVAMGSAHPNLVPYRAFEAKDGFVNIAAFGDVMWKRFCDALNADGLFADPDYQSVRDRSSKHEKIKADMNKVTSQLLVGDLVRILNEAGVPTGPINNIGEGFEDPQVKHLKLAKPAPHPELGDLSLVRSPINLSLFPQSDSFDNAAPDPGENSETVLRDMGFDESRIVSLKEEGVIG